MQIDQLREYLDQPDRAAEWLRTWGVDDVVRAHVNLVGMATAGITLDLLADTCDQLAEHLPGCPAPDMALNNLERFISSARNPLSLGSLFSRDRMALPILVQIFSTSQHFSDLLVRDPEGYDPLRMTEGQPVARDLLVEEIAAEVESQPSEPAVFATLRRLKHREILRVAYGDIVRKQPLETVTAQISYLADALIEGALRAARALLERRHGIPRGDQGQVAQLTVVALGKLGGVELNYSSDIDLILLYDHEGKTDGRQPVSNAEFFERLARKLIELLSKSTATGDVWPVDLRLRPLGSQGPVVVTVNSAWRYYDALGRTWERQALIKARACAGDLELGRRFLRELEPWIYPRYLGMAEIAEIKSLKRRIEERTIRGGDESREVKTGHGGIRDIEFVVQFLQLLHGGELHEVRTGNTLQAMARLESTGCLLGQERRVLEESYRFLRKIEHRVQIMFHLQTHLLPSDQEELGRLARRMGYVDQDGRTASEQFEADYQNRTRLNRKILNFLLHEPFQDEPTAEPEVDLVLVPDPSPEEIQAVLGKYGFRDVKRAYEGLMSLARERTRFLSSRRCRHFLAAIAARLLETIAATPDPDSTLVNLEKVSDSLGGNGVLWELFSFSPPTLHLYVELCASSPYLSGILTSNPGMIDDLMDSLVLNKLPTLEWLRRRLAELCHAAEDIDPILRSFKNAQLLRIGVRDILGKDPVQATTGALSDIAQACLEQIAIREYDRLLPRMGEPTMGSGPRAGQTCPLTILALGKFGGRELNYHSDLDIVFLYEAEGSTRATSRRTETTSNQHFFSELAQRIIKVATHLGPHGRLYEIDARLRPAGRSGPLATSLSRLARYFHEGTGALWERQAFCRARVVYGGDEDASRATQVIEQAAYNAAWQPSNVDEIRDMRRRLEETAGPMDLKRGPGGLVDTEFLVQMLQLKYGGAEPSLRQPNTLDALAVLHEAGHLSRADFQTLEANYRLLRRIEGRLRLLSSSARDELPHEPDELAKLARLLGFTDGEALSAACAKATQATRAIFQRTLAKSR